MSKSASPRLKRRIELDRVNGWVFGVCGGLSNYLRIDPAITRVGVLVTALFFPKIVIASYLVAWLYLDGRLN